MGTGRGAREVREPQSDCYTNKKMQNDLKMINKHIKKDQKTTKLTQNIQTESQPGAPVYVLGLI